MENAGRTQSKDAAPAWNEFAPTNVGWAVLLSDMKTEQSRNRDVSMLSHRSDNDSQEVHDLNDL